MGLHVVVVSQRLQLNGAKRPDVPLFNDVGK